MNNKKKKYPLKKLPDSKRQKVNSFISINSDSDEGLYEDSNFDSMDSEREEFAFDDDDLEFLGNVENKPKTTKFHNDNIIIEDDYNINDSESYNEEDEENENNEEEPFQPEGRFIDDEEEEEEFVNYKEEVKKKTKKTKKEKKWEVESIRNKMVDDSGNIWYHVHWKGYSSASDTWEPASNLAYCEKLLKKFEKKKILHEMKNEYSIYKVDKIIDRRLNSNREIEYLVKWVGYDEKDNTWEPETNIFDKSIIADYERSRKKEKNTVKSDPTRSERALARKKEREKELEKERERARLLQKETTKLRPKLRSDRVNNGLKLKRPSTIQSFIIKLPFPVQWEFLRRTAPFGPTRLNKWKIADIRKIADLAELTEVQNFLEGICPINSPNTSVPVTKKSNRPAHLRNRTDHFDFSYSIRISYINNEDGGKSNGDHDENGQFDSDEEIKQDTKMNGKKKRNNSMGTVINIDDDDDITFLKTLPFSIMSSRNKQSNGAQQINIQSDDEEELHIDESEEEEENNNQHSEVEEDRVNIENNQKESGEENKQKKKKKGIELLEIGESLSCRFWRKYGSDRFLSASFSASLPASKIEKVCKEGISLPILQRHYKFLYSKPLERKAVFFCENIEPIFSVQDIRNWHCPISGKFAENLSMNICKYNARMTLGFSDSVAATRIPFNETQIVDDLYGDEEKKNLLTDGCSLISLALLNTIKNEVKLANTPSAVQGRYGSAKGVWVVGDISQMKRIQLHRTKSQVKYKLKPQDEYQEMFELIQYSRDTGPASLNRQFIRVLDYLGVPTETFLQLQKEAIQYYCNELMSSPENALQLLVRSMNSNEIPKEKLACDLLFAGFDFNEPYLHHLISIIVKKNLKKMRDKADIQVLKSRNVLMIPDPTGTLEEYECFLQVSGNIDTSNFFESQPLFIGDITPAGVIRGDVIVTRNPCQLPSDIQRLRAVDCPKLRHIVDCVVFSVKGNRSVASLLSGGDYDGDIAFVCWDERLTCISTYSNTPDPIDLNDSAITIDPASEITVGDALFENGVNPSYHILDEYLIQHFVQQLEYNKLGELSHLHAKWAESVGIDHETTIRIAQLCALSVDAAKGGMLIRLPNDIEEKEWPHYIRKSGYHSNSTLGKLYDDMCSDNLLDRSFSLSLSGNAEDEEEIEEHNFNSLQKNISKKLDSDLVISDIPEKWQKKAKKMVDLFVWSMKEIAEKGFSKSEKTKLCKKLEENLRSQFLAVTKNDYSISLFFTSALYQISYLYTPEDNEEDLKMQKIWNFGVKMIPWLACPDHLTRIKADAINSRDQMNSIAPTIIRSYWKSIRLVT